MPHGGPDWGTAGPLKAIFTVDDLGELAARLGSVITYDRRGNVIDFDSFEDPFLKWDHGGSVAACYARLDHASVRSGCQAVKLYTTAVNDYFSSIFRYWVLTGSKRLGVEFSVSNLSRFCDLFLEMDYRDGVNYHSAIMKFDAKNGILYVYKADDTWPEVARYKPLHRILHMYYTFKLVVDFSTDKYMRVLLNLDEYPIPDIDVFHVLNPEAPRLMTTIMIKNTSADVNEAYIDDFIYTQNEP